jgi:hypothetical protein
MDNMTITSAQYYNDIQGNHQGIKAIIDGLQLSVPLDPANRHYIALMEWASQDGNTIEDAD